MFLKLDLSYKFTCTLVETGEHPTMRFLFSKPTKEKPIPAITGAISEESYTVLLRVNTSYQNLLDNTPRGP